VPVRSTPFTQLAVYRAFVGITYITRVAEGR
jgi:hypothetical protein